MRAIVLPVKRLEDAKVRLGSVLAPLERAALTLAMLEDVLDAALVVPGWDTWVLSPDEAVLEVAAGRGARAVTEDEPPLAAAIHQAEDEALGRGADALAVVLPDTPLVTAGALTRALHTLGPVVVAPSTDERGTNLLLRRPPRAIEARFGPDSYRRHLEAAAEADLPIAVVVGPELGFDLDAPNDILTVLEGPGTTRTKAVLRDLRIERTDGRARRRDLRRTSVQGTIKHYDEASHRGSLLTDDRTEIAIDERSLADPSILLLRIGQRVRFEVEAAEDGSVARGLHLVTF